MKPKQPIFLEAFASALRSFRWVALILFVVYLLSATMVVQPGEVALVLRFGKLVGATREDQIRRPGLLLAMPYPIDRVIRVPIKEEGEVLIQELWKSLTEGGPPTTTIDPLKEGYCLTGDQNILQARLVAKFRIDDPIAYALSIENPRGFIHLAICELNSSERKVLVSRRKPDGAKPRGSLQAKFLRPRRSAIVSSKRPWRTRAHCEPEPLRRYPSIRRFTMNIVATPP